MHICVCSQSPCQHGLRHRPQCDGRYLHISIVYIDPLGLQLISQGSVDRHHQIIADLGLLDTLRKESMQMRRVCQRVNSPVPTM